MLVLAAGAAGVSRGQETPPDLTAVGLEAVMQMEVTSVSKRPEKLMGAPAAVMVITSEEIRRSGATSLPELLRLVPGVQVARIDSNQWAVGVRGFTNALSRSLLVLIDGRSVYSPLFAGVYWDTQDLLLQDVDRIEVIRGPGATLWGANAVNGVINVITRSAGRTAGAFAFLGGGNQERVVAGVRSGSELSGKVALRSYARFFDRSEEFHLDGDEYDDWQMTRAGFRLDADPGEEDTLAIQASAYDGRAGQRAILTTYDAPYQQTVRENADLWGGHLLGQWSHATSEASDRTVSFYFDRTHRRQPGLTEDRYTLDLEYRHHRLFASRHNVVWGAGYRVTSGDTESVETTRFIPSARADDTVNAFVQDEIHIVPARWILTLGTKVEHNDYSGFNAQPNVRLLYSPSANHVLWAAVSRALRIASRVEEDLSLTALLEPATPTFVRLQGIEDFEPERLIAYEVGYRAQAADNLSFDLALFHNDYVRLLSLEPGTPFVEPTPAPAHAVVPLFIGNGLEARVLGAELAAEWRPFPRWQLNGSYSYLSMDVTASRGSLDTTTGSGIEGSSPRHLAGLRSFLDLPGDLSVDVTLRYVDELPGQQVEAYTEMDVSVTHGLTRNLDLSLTGQNLLSSHHAEFAGGGAGAVEIRRSLYGRLVLRW